VKKIVAIILVILYANLAFGGLANGNPCKQACERNTVYDNANRLSGCLTLSDNDCYNWQVTLCDADMQKQESLALQSSAPLIIPHTVSADREQHFQTWLPVAAGYNSAKKDKTSREFLSFIHVLRI